MASCRCLYQHKGHVGEYAKMGCDSLFIPRQTKFCFPETTVRELKSLAQPEEVKLVVWEFFQYSTYKVSKAAKENCIVSFG